MSESELEPEVAAEPESLFEAPPMGEQERMVEAILFATAEPVTIAELNARMPHGADAKEAIEHLRKRYEGRGVAVVRVGEAWAMRTASDLGFLMQKETVETRKLSRAAIETLAIIAYHQPVTRSEIEEIRGVSVSRGTVDQLLELEWIKFGRRKLTPGRPVTFMVTEEFLDHFGLENARDLPGLKELRAAGLLENRPPPGTGLEDVEDEDDDDDQTDMFAPAGDDNEVDGIVIEDAVDDDLVEDDDAEDDDAKDDGAEDDCVEGHETEEEDSDERQPSD